MSQASKKFELRAHILPLATLLWFVVFGRQQLCDFKANLAPEASTSVQVEMDQIQQTDAGTRLQFSEETYKGLSSTDIHCDTINSKKDR